MMGLYNSACYTKHRQEIYTNNLASYMSDSESDVFASLVLELTTQWVAFEALQDQLGDVNSQPFWDLYHKFFDSGGIMSQLRAFFESALKELPKV